MDETFLSDETAVPLDLRAWTVWEDAAVAISRLDERVNDQPNTNWRIDYLAAITALRAIGHVLGKADCGVSPEAKRRIEARWPRMNKHPLFQWLEDSRNRVIKLYEMDVHLMKGWGWTGNASRPEDAPDAKQTGILFIGDSAEPLTDKLWEIWQWWGEWLAAIRFDRECKWLED